MILWFSNLMDFVANITVIAGNDILETKLFCTIKHFLIWDWMSALAPMTS